MKMSKFLIVTVATLGAAGWGMTANADAAGKAKFEAACAECHEAGDFAGEDAKGLADSIKKIAAGQVKHKSAIKLTDAEIADVAAYMADLGRRARAAARLLARAETAAKDRALLAMVEEIDRRRAEIAAANAEDLAAGAAKGLDAAMLDRLELTPGRIDSMIEGLRQIAGLADPIGAITDLNYRPSGIQVGRMRVPLGVVGSLAGVWLRDMPNDVYFKVGLITIIGLSAKNAILIIEFAKDLQAEGKSLLEATLEACHLRFRPIIMTSFAFILGVLPLAIASGAGSASQRAIGTGVMAGMITATVLAVLLVPVFYVVIRRLFPSTHVAPHGTSIASAATDAAAAAALTTKEGR